MIYEVWCEGWAATEDFSSASLLGSAEAGSFQDACKQILQAKGILSFYDPLRNTWWGCRLFDNEADARKAFG